MSWQLIVVIYLVAIAIWVNTTLVRRRMARGPRTPEELEKANWNFIMGPRLPAPPASFDVELFEQRVENILSDDPFRDFSIDDVIRGCEPRSLQEEEARLREQQTPESIRRSRNCNHMFAEDNPYCLQCGAHVSNAYPGELIVAVEDDYENEQLEHLSPGDQYVMKERLDEERAVAKCYYCAEWHRRNKMCEAKRKHDMLTHAERKAHAQLRARENADDLYSQTRETRLLRQAVQAGMLTTNEAHAKLNTIRSGGTVALPQAGKAAALKRRAR